MKLRNIGSNQTLLFTSDDTVILFSYDTPVAACIDGRYVRTNKHYSNTTTRHINSFVRDCDIVDQSFIDNLIN
jgi:hypothetical protein